jgi:hypothetical protein
MMTIIPDTATTVVRASHVPGPPQGQWTYEDYAKLPDLDGFHYEIIGGVLYIAPAPIPEHERIAMLIGARLVAAVEDTGLGQVFGSPDIDVGLTTVRPDAAVVLNEHADIVAEKRLIGPPDLVVEIASPSTAPMIAILMRGSGARMRGLALPSIGSPIRSIGALRYWCWKRIPTARSAPFTAMIASPHACCRVSQCRYTASFLVNCET